MIAGQCQQDHVHQENKFPCVHVMIFHHSDQVTNKKYFLTQFNTFFLVSLQLITFPRGMPRPVVPVAFPCGMLSASRCVVDGGGGGVQEELGGEDKYFTSPQVQTTKNICIPHRGQFNDREFQKTFTFVYRVPRSYSLIRLEQANWLRGRSFMEQIS